MKSLVVLWHTMHEELCIRCGTECAEGDRKTVSARVHSEGLSFLTITLPQYHRDFLKALDTGIVTPDLFPGFRLNGRGPIPLFLGGMVGQVFDETSGRLLDDPNIDAIFAVRQLTLAFSKILVQASDRRIRSAMQGYIETDKQVAASQLDLERTEESEFLETGMLLWADVFSAVDRKIYEHDLRPSHGPGSTADRLLGNQKFSQTEWTQRLEEIFPAGEYLIPNWREGETSLDHVTWLDPGAERPVKVIPVPKTLKTPRIIAIEPTCMQYMQQAISKQIQKSITNDPHLRDLVGFDDQVPNQDFARRGSLDGHLATLDLSEASDRVSNLHVSLLTARYPWLHAGIQACRSTKASVPVGRDREVIELNKFASMGSALTFPIEAMIFLTIIASCVKVEPGRLRTREGILKALRGCVRVYGDDIIIPVDMVQDVTSRLEAFGFKVNADKSFWTGKFRESCGKDYYAGHDVTTVKVRRVFPQSRLDAREIISLVSTRNQFYMAGMWMTAKFIDEWIGRLRLPFPIVGEDSPAVGRRSVAFEPVGEKQCPFLHRPLVKAMVVDSRIPINRLDGRDALLKCLLYDGREPNPDKKHLERSGRPDSVRIKIRYTSTQ